MSMVALSHCHIGQE
jgi:methylthioribose-1-phosphate isomerase